jgi:hypothetical protein
MTSQSEDDIRVLDLPELVSMALEDDEVHK